MAVLEHQASEGALDRTLGHFGRRISTPPSSPAGIFSETARRSLRNLSSQALRANRKAEETLQQYTTAQQGAKSGCGVASDALGMADLIDRTQSCSSRSVPPSALHGTSKDWEQSFNDDAMAVDVLIQTLASNLRYDSMKNDKLREAEQLAKAREEQRRARAAEERLARQREAVARDPHKKVSMKIENTRKYNMEAVHEMGIPMTQVQFTGSAGVESVDMVDYSKIRQRCKQMDTGSTPSVRALVEEQARLDRQSCSPSKLAKAKAVSMGDLHSHQSSGRKCKFYSSVGVGKGSKGMCLTRGSMASRHRGFLESAERTPSMARRDAWQESAQTSE